MDLDSHWIWLVAAAALALAELVVPGVFLIWFAAAAAVAGLFALIFDPSVVMQLLVFAAGAVVAVIAGRSWYLANPIDTIDPLLNDRGARLIGKLVTVETAIVHGEGRVSVADGTWSAHGPDSPVGTKLRIIGCEQGVLLVDHDNALPPPG